LLAIAAAWSGGKTIADESSGKAHDDRRPNIVLFVVDDLGWQDSGVSFTDNDTPFQQHFQTPNLWRLAAGGVRLSRAYSCAGCSPARVSLLTGQNAARHRVTNWILHADRETSGQTSRLAPPADWRRMGIDDVLTLPMILRHQGYATIHSGKAHFGEAGTPFSDPRNLGFDINIGGRAAEPRTLKSAATGRSMSCGESKTGIWTESTRPLSSY
jgi:arylsulfatase A-like enzyme